MNVMPFIFKQKPNPHLWSLSYFLQNSYNNNDKVQVENIDEQLKANICSILNSVSDETVSGIIHALKYVGLESLSDLKFVQEDDLILVLKPIQRRKLIKAWSEQMFPLVKSSNAPLQKIKWKRKKCLVLLQVYAKYKTELLCPGVEKRDIWQKIAKEVQQRCSINCDELQCMEKIEELRTEYQTLKKKTVISKDMIVFFSEAKYAFETAENSDISSTSVSNTLSGKKCIWKKRMIPNLLQVYMKYKIEFSHPDVEEQTVWKKIAAEIKKTYNRNFNELDCCNKINELRSEYDRIKNNPATNRTTAIFLDKAREAFKTTENPDNCSEQSSNTSLRSCSRMRNIEGFRCSLLEVYTNYKNELDHPDTEKQKVWEKIAREIREKFSYDCGESLCQFELSQLKCEHEDIKNREVPSFSEDPRETFENSEVSSFQGNGMNRNAEKYVPPHLRNGENSQKESVISSGTVNFSTEQSSNTPPLNCKMTKENYFHCRLLQVYTKYKNELSHPDTEEQKVWEKIARELREKFFYSCSESLCEFEVSQLKLDYEALKKEGIKEEAVPYYFKYFKGAFEDPEVSNFQDNGANENIGKYVPPHLRNGENIPKEAVISHKAGNSSSSVPNNISVDMREWEKGMTLHLLDMYAKYKIEFSHPNVEEETVWEKIASEIQKSTHRLFDGLDCYSKIDELRSEYERIKNEPIPDRETALFLDRAREAFKIGNFSTKQSSSTPLVSCKKLQNIKGFHCRLLQVYTKYKNELDHPDTEKQKVWEKIARELRVKFSYNCGESFCQFELHQLKCEYEDVKTGDVPYFFEYAKEAFGNSEASSFQDNKMNSNVAKYVPPPLRNGE